MIALCSETFPVVISDRSDQIVAQVDRTRRNHDRSYPFHRGEIEVPMDQTIVAGVEKQNVRLGASTATLGYYGDTLVTLW